MSGRSNLSKIKHKGNYDVYVIYENADDTGDVFCIGLAEIGSGRRLVVRWDKSNYPRDSWFELPDVAGINKYTSYTDINALITALQDFKEGKLSET